MKPMTENATRRLGATDMDITRVGFGAWAIGGGDWAYAWGAQDDADSVAAIRAAVAAGVNWLDTAAVYGLGHSEEVVATALAEIPETDRPLVFTKGGQVWDEADRSSEPRRVMAPASVRREVDASLRRLGVDRIDLYQVHWPPDDGTPIEEYWGTLAELRDEGKLRAIGLSNHGVEQLEAAERVAHVDAIQPPFSAIVRSAAPQIAWAASHDTGVIVYSPMQSGLLTGAFSRARVESLPADDWRRDHREFTTNLERNLALADALRPVAKRHDTTLGAVAVAWTLAWDGVSGAIVGARRPEQVEGWIDAAWLELTELDLDEIAAAIERTGAGSGPIGPEAMASR
jgi:aryl-alcohol dehydrogenase-like predicted oxidoreductase